MDTNQRQSRDRAIERVNAWPEWKRKAFTYREVKVKPVKVHKKDQAATMELTPGQAVDIGSHILFCNEPGNIVSFPKQAPYVSSSKPAAQFGNYVEKYPRVPPGTQIIIEVE